MKDSKSLTFTEFGLMSKLKVLRLEIESYLKNNEASFPLQSDIPIKNRKHFDELLYQLEKIEKIYGEINEKT